MFFIDTGGCVWLGEVGVGLTFGLLLALCIYLRLAAIVDWIPFARLCCCCDLVGGCKCVVGINVGIVLLIGIETAAALLDVGFIDLLSFGMCVSVIVYLFLFSAAYLSMLIESQISNWLLSANTIYK